MTSRRRELRFARNIAGAIGATLLFAGLASAPAAFAVDTEVGTIDEGSGFDLTATSTAVAPGGTVSFTDIDAAPQQQIQLYFEYLSWFAPGPNLDYGPDFWTTITGGTGDPRDGEVTLPEAIAPGEYLLYYSCGSGDAISCSGTIPFTVLGDIPGTEPAGVDINFAPDSLEGKAGDPVNVTGNCTYNGVGADAVHADWSYASTGEEAQTARLGDFPLAGGGTLNEQLQVPADARPQTDEIFGNGLSLSCDLGQVVVGLSRFDFTVQGAATGTVPPRPTTPTNPTTPVPAPAPAPAPMLQAPPVSRPAAAAPKQLAATGTNQGALVLGTLGVLTLGAALILATLTPRRSSGECDSRLLAMSRPTSS